MEEIKNVVLAKFKPEISAKEIDKLIKQGDFWWLREETLMMRERGERERRRRTRERGFLVDWVQFESRLEFRIGCMGKIWGS
ncbi:hypothetical protein LINPERPRIM_LOCUS38801 [Linum perenne]